MAHRRKSPHRRKREPRDAVTQRRLLRSRDRSGLTPPPASPAPVRRPVNPYRSLRIGLGGAATLAAIELAALHSAAPGAWWVTVAVLALAGLATASCLAIAERVIARLGPPSPVPELLRAAGTLVVLIPVGRHLFDGGFASTLPIARAAVLWVPLCGWLGLAAMLWIGERLLGAAGRGRRFTVAALLVLAVAAIEYANRTLYRTQYPELHLLLLVLGCAGAGVAVDLIAGRPGEQVPAPVAAPSGRAPPAPPPARFWRRFVALELAAGLAIFGTATAVAGRIDRDARFVLATRGMHTHLLLDTLRAALGVNLSSDGGPGEGAAVEIAQPRRRVSGVSPADPHLHVLLVLCDALRADVTLPTDENRRDFPNLLGFVDGARRFRRTFAPAAGTDVSVSTIVTSRTSVFAGAEITLAEAMRRAGRGTYAVYPTEMLRWIGTALVTRGVDRWERLVSDAEERDTSRHGTGARTTDLGFALLDRHLASDSARPFFAWLHYFDVHEHDDLSPSDAALGEAVMRMGRAPDARSAARLLRRDRVLKYRAAVALFDRELGRIEDRLRKNGARERTVVVLASDHGESLGEDPRLPAHHGDFLYEPLVRVPLAIRVPGVAPAEVYATVTLADLLPTLLELVGATPPPGLAGRSLVPELSLPPEEAMAGDARPVVMNEALQHGVVRWPWKLLVRPGDDLVELYDLADDPGERRDLAEQEPALVAELRQLYRSFPKVRFDRTLRGRLRRERAAEETALP